MENQFCFSILGYLLFPWALHSEANILAGMKRPLCKCTHPWDWNYSSVREQSSSRKFYWKTEWDWRCRGAKKWSCAIGLPWGIEKCSQWPKKLWLQHWELFDKLTKIKPYRCPHAMQHVPHSKRFNHKASSTLLYCSWLGLQHPILHSPYLQQSLTKAHWLVLVSHKDTLQLWEVFKHSGWEKLLQYVFAAINNAMS